MAAPPIDEWTVIDYLTKWITWVIGGIIAFSSAVVTATYFIVNLRNDIEELKKRMEEEVEERGKTRNQLHTEVRTAVHDLRNEFHKAHGDNQAIMRRIDDHVLRVEARSDQRFDQLIKLLIDRKGDG